MATDLDADLQRAIKAWQDSLPTAAEATARMIEIGHLVGGSLDSFRSNLDQILGTADARPPTAATGPAALPAPESEDAES